MGKDLIKEAKAQVKANKQPRTIKVKTLVKHMIIATTMAALFIGGMVVGNFQKEAQINGDNQRAVNRIEVIQDLVKVLK